jgi:hypothetical protein
VKCTGDDGACQKPARRKGLCWGHLRRLKKKGHSSGSLRGHGQSDWTLLAGAALTYARAEQSFSDTEGDVSGALDELEKAAAHLRVTALRYGEGRRRRAGPRPKKAS